MAFAEKPISRACFRTVNGTTVTYHWCDERVTELSEADVFRLQFTVIVPVVAVT